MKLTKEQLIDARNWIADCHWPDLEPEDIAELTDVQIELGIKRHYNGGIEQFIKDGFYN